MSLALGHAALLSAPLRLGALALPNRVVTAPLTRALAAESGKPSPVTARFYAQRAAAGLIVTEPVWITPEGAGPAHTPGLWRDSHVAAWREVTAAVHAAGGRIAVQLWHAGRLSHALATPGGVGPVAPSAIAAEGWIDTPAGRRAFPQPRQLATEELPRLVQDFAMAARRARAAGFDAVEILAGEGALLAQFLDPASNRRSDGHGGSPANRARLAVEVATAVAGAIGPERTGLRVSLPPDGEAADTWSGSSLLALVDRLRPLELAWLQVVDAGPGPGSPMLPALRAGFAGPMILNAGHGWAGAEAALRDGTAEAVAFERPFFTEAASPAPPLPGGTAGGDGGVPWRDAAAALWLRVAAPHESRAVEWDAY